MGHRTTNILDVAGQLRAVQDARGSLWSFTYDATGMRTNQIDPLGRITTSGYDPAGQQVLRIDARGNRTTYLFDPVGQLTRRWYPDNTRATFLFDAVGNRTGMRDTTGVYTYTFDALNQFASVHQSSVGIITYSFDVLGRRRSMIAPTGGYFTYAYDQANRLAWMSNPEGDRTTFSYDVADRRTLKQLANGTRASFTYDSADQILQLFNLRSDDSLISGFTYETDAVGSRTSVLEGTGDRVTWTYDQTNRLTSEHRSGAHACFNTFVYDPVGNRRLKLEDGATTTSTYDVANQLLTSSDVTGQTHFLFDANGNQQVVEYPDNTLTTTTWNYENQPTVYEKPDTTRVTMTYNADNRRVSKASPSAKTNSVWDTESDNVLTETDDFGTTLAVYTNEPNQFGELVSQRRAGTTSWVYADALGSIWNLCDTSETITDSYLYDAWGNILSGTGSTVNPFKYVGAYGYYFDMETGSNYVRARVYEPTIARWWSQDPIEFGESVLASRDHLRYIDGLNLYIYVRSHPTSTADWSGQAPIIPAAFAGCVGASIWSSAAAWIGGRGQCECICAGGFGCAAGGAVGAMMTIPVLNASPIIQCVVGAILGFLRGTAVHRTCAYICRTPHALFGCALANAMVQAALGCGSRFAGDVSSVNRATAEILTRLFGDEIKQICDDYLADVFPRDSRQPDIPVVTEEPYSPVDHVEATRHFCERSCYRKCFDDRDPEACMDRCVSKCLRDNPVW